MHEPQRPLNIGLFESEIPQAQKRALTIAQSIVRNHHDAEEVVQEALIASFKNLGRIEENELDPYLSRVTRNRAIDRYRHEGLRRHEDVDGGRAIATSDQSTDPEAATISKETTVLVQAAIGSLKPEQRQVVVMCDMNGMTHLEAAAALGKPVGTIKSRSARAHAALRKALQAQL